MRRLLLLLALLGCTGEMQSINSPEDAGWASDASIAADATFGSDAAIEGDADVREDASIVADAGLVADASMAIDGGSERDAGFDAGFDARADSGLDAGFDDAGFDAGIIDERPSSERHTPRPLGTTDSTLGYWEYLPPNYGAEPAPLLVFWHGIGEFGNGDSQLNRVLIHGPPKLISRNEWPNDRPFVALSPQVPARRCPNNDEIADFFAFALEEYDIDPNRVYLTGLSCGAIGSWNYLARELDDTPVAAAVLIAGNGTGTGWRGCDLARIPIWGFHGDSDGVVGVRGTREPMERLMACPEPRGEQRLTIYPGVGHDSWSRTYNGSAGHDIYSWMLRQPL